MADLVFYTNPQSRGRIVRWMLEEVGRPYETQIIPYEEMKSERYLAVNPMGKVPAIKHRDHIVTECAAICTYLADVFPEAMLGPAIGRESRLLSLAVLRRGTGRACGHQQFRQVRGEPGATPDVRLRQFRRGRGGARRPVQVARLSSAATVSPPPTSMSVRRSCSRCSSACFRSATASSNTGTGCRRGMRTSARPTSTRKSSMRCGLRPPQPQPA